MSYKKVIMKNLLILLLIVSGLSGCGGNKTRLLDFPNTRQSFVYSCGPGSVQAVMAYYGENFRESDLIDKLKTDKDDGTYLRDMVKFLNANGLTTSLKQNMTTDELFSYINRKIPVIVLIQAWGNEEDFKNNYRTCWDDGHFVVVIGYNEKEVLLSDPAIFSTGYIPIGEFMERWHDVDGKTKTYRLGLAVYGKEPKFVKNKFERIE
jgi:predicted double-glycine peptidase